MLIEFRFKNYKCFRDEQVLSLVANNKDKQHKERLLGNEALRGIKLLPSIVIYGPNAAGKTTVLDALAFCKRFVLSSAKYEPTKEIPVIPFRLDLLSASEPSEFEITLLIEGVRYQYGFICDRQRVYEEWLISFPRGRSRRLFHRKIDKEKGKSVYSFSPYFKGEKEKIAKVTRKNSLFLSMGATIFQQPDLVQVYKWFANSLHGAEARRLDVGMFIDLITNEQYLETIRTLIKIADLGITDILVSTEEGNGALEKEIPDDAPPEIKKLWKAIKTFVEESSGDIQKIQIHTKHIRSDGAPVSFILDDESAGTQQYFVISLLMLHALREGSVLFVDELSNSLHPLLARKVVELFHSPSINAKGAQLIFNTHDVTLLSLSVFRRDQIWFVEKDNTGTSHLFSLLEFSPRRQEALGKGYLQGRYGAIPFLDFTPEELFE